MKMFKALDTVEVSECLLKEKHSIMEGAVKKYCKLKREGKTHRSVSDRNVGDVTEIERSIPLYINNTNQDSSVSNGNDHVKEELIGLLLNKMTCTVRSATGVEMRPNNP